jgi:CubicO group peptidase (beta-lactamase class C family)
MSAAIAGSGRPKGTAMWRLPELEQVLRRAVEAKEVPGVVAIAATDQRIVYEAALGRCDLSRPEPMRIDTVFRIHSMTKAITCTAAMQLVEQGRLSLDRPIAAVLPDLASRQVLEGFDAQGRPRLRPATRPITLRQLMTHTAGFGYDIWNAKLLAYLQREGIPGIVSGELMALTAPLVFDPGERWEYGINVDIVGRAVERVSGQTLDAYFAQHIFAPLGMKDTAYRPDDSLQSRLATMHQRRENGSLEPLAFALTPPPEFYGGGGGLFSTARDYIAFMRMLLNGGTLDGARILKAETVAAMGENHIGELAVVPLKTAQPLRSNDVELLPGRVKKWGLSFLINTERTAEGRSPGSLAWAGLANTFFWMDPQRKIGGALFTQILPFGDAKALELFAAFEKNIYCKLDRGQPAA